MSAAMNLLRSAPEAQGVDSAAILAFAEAAEREIDSLHSFMLLRHDRVIAEGWWAPYGPQSPHMLFSLSKSFASTAVGFAVSEGLLTVDDLVLPYFPEDAPADRSAYLSAMKVRHLLSMSTGHDEDATGSATGQSEGNWAKGFLGQAVTHEPGTHFVYNSAATYMLSAIVQKLTGMPILDYLKPRLFDPLGIENPTWETCPRGINVGGWGLKIRTEDIARFGQLYLRKGVWNGERLLPESWVEEASAKHVSNGDNPESDWAQGYGYQFWRCRHGAYRGDGAFGQYCVVMPEQDAVLAITSGLGDMQAPLNLVWNHLLPAMKPEPLPESDAADELSRKLSRLSLKTPSGSPSSPVSKPIAGKTFVFEPNDRKLESVFFDFQGDRCAITFKDDAKTHRIESCCGHWSKSETTFEAFDSNRPHPVAASGAWTDEETMEVRLCLYETPFRPTLSFRFTGDQVAFDFKGNVGFGPSERPRLIGRLQ